MRRTSLLGATLAVLAACGGGDDSPANMALACQTTTCICVNSGGLLRDDTDRKDVLWKQNGDAYCPPKYALTLARR